MVQHYVKSLSLSSYYLVPKFLFFAISSSNPNYTINFVVYEQQKRMLIGSVNCSVRH